MDNGIDRFTDSLASAAAIDASHKVDSVMSNMMLDANAVYIQAANEAAVRAKTVGREQALREAVASIADKGVAAYSFYTKDGTKVDVSADAGIRRIVNDAMRSRQIDQVLGIAERTGQNLVEVNTTANARKSHAEWQGKVYSLNGSTDKYPNFEESCHVGDPVNGIGGYNCGHTIAIYYEGHKKVFADPLEGTGYTTEQVRRLTTKQRTLERNIREKKRVVEVLKNCGFDASPEKAKLRSLEQSLATLIEKHHEVLRRRRNYREGIYGIRRARTSQKAKEAVHLYKSDAALLSELVSSVEIVVGGKKVSPTVHLLYQMTDRGVHIWGLVEAMEHPVKVVKKAPNEVKYIGREVVLIYNPIKNVIVTVWRRTR